jgi:hypothetical protein
MDAVHPAKTRLSVRVLMHDDRVLMRDELGKYHERVTSRN